MNKSILVFTDKYPYGVGEPFFGSELEYLSKTFGKVTILPVECLNSKFHRNIPNKVSLMSPPFRSIKNKKELILKGLFNGSVIFPFIKELYKERVFLSTKKFWNWFTHFLLIRAELSFLRSQDFNNYDVYYFYWGLRWSQVLPFYEFKSKTVVRFHGSDLYDERNNGYIPFRKEQLAKIDLSVFVSEMGKNYLFGKYPLFLKEACVSRIGTEDYGSGNFNKNKIHIVSCSNIIPLKQIELLAKALKYVSLVAQWTHIGDGPLKNQIINLTSELNKNVQVCFKGQLNLDELMDFYKETSVSVFINTSLSEGVPVSVMEAMSFGIPVIATDVGGTKEIVDEEVGYLISSSISPKELALRIESLIGREDYINLRKNARKRWEERCQASILFTDFVNKLKSL